MENEIKPGFGLLIISLIGNSFIGYNVNSNSTLLDMVCAVLQRTLLYSLDILALYKRFNSSIKIIRLYNCFLIETLIF